MKDYKSFFIKTRRFISILDNHQLKIATKVQIAKGWYQMRMTLHLSLCHKHTARLSRTNFRRLLLNVFAEQLILNA